MPSRTRLPPRGISAAVVISGRARTSRSPNEVALGHPGVQLPHQSRELFAAIRHGSSRPTASRRVKASSRSCMVRHAASNRFGPAI
jgi:hypothetical protein